MQVVLLKIFVLLLIFSVNFRFSDSQIYEPESFDPEIHSDEFEYEFQNYKKRFMSSEESDESDDEEYEDFNANRDIGCRDESGKLVDWYYLYKLPRKYSDKSSSGLEYLYLTPSSQSSWKLSSKLINSTDSMPGRTLSFIYKSKLSSRNLVAMYNDGPANEAYDFMMGHTKGVIVVNEAGGFWMIHSVPKFPPPLKMNVYDYPKSGTVYGQSFLCISFTHSEMRRVGKQLKFNEPRFYSTQVPVGLRRFYPEIIEALKMRKITQEPFYSIAILKSRYGSTFTSFAKSAEFSKELYEDLVAPHYNSGDFYVETWRNGRGNLKSDCSKPTKVYNVHDISIDGDEVIQFPTKNDHSKWMVSEENDLICVGDINRAEHQKTRGGGTVCSQFENIAKVYSSAVADAEPCERVKSKKKKNKKSRKAKVWRNYIRNDY